MTEFASLSVEEQRRLEAAATWHVHIRKDPALELSPEFLQWIDDSQNRNAFEAVDLGWSQIRDCATAPELLDMRKAALGDARRLRTRQWLPRFGPRWAAAALLVFALVGTGFGYILTEAKSYATEVGERRMLSLSDGSRISLDSSTKLLVKYTKSDRLLTLEQGRARFDVAHDVGRPFSVVAGRKTIVAVGTAFDVEILGSKTVVTLIQGHVVVKDTDADARVSLTVQPRSTQSLSAGEELVAFGDAKPAIKPVNLQSATAWEVGHLVFKDVALTEAVEQVNRYLEKPISVDPAIASIRISGVFNAGDTRAFIGAVTSYFPIEATHNAQNDVTLRRRS